MAVKSNPRREQSPSQWRRYAQYGARRIEEWLEGEDWQQRAHPIFLHKPRGTPRDGITLGVWINFNRLARTVTRNLSSRRYSRLHNVTFVTYSTYSSLRLVEKCYLAYGMDYVVLGKHVAHWSWLKKIDLVLTWLATCNTDYIVVTDANDVLLIGNPSPIVEYFNEYDCDVLFCNTVADWPPHEEYRLFESITYATHPLHSHLSAGGFMARRVALGSYLHEIVKAHQEGETWMLFDGSFDDQLSWRHLHYKYYPRVKVDYRSLIFKRYDIFRTLDY
jgi:hypothetical protein